MPTRKPTTSKQSPKKSAAAVKQPKPEDSTAARPTPRTMLIDGAGLAGHVAKGLDGGPLSDGAANLAVRIRALSKRPGLLERLRGHIRDYVELDESAYVAWFLGRSRRQEEVRNNPALRGPEPPQGGQWTWETIGRSDVNCVDVCGWIPAEFAEGRQPDGGRLMPPYKGREPSLRGKCVIAAAIHDAYFREGVTPLLPGIVNYDSASGHPALGRLVTSSFGVTVIGIVEYCVEPLWKSCRHLMEDYVESLEQELAPANEGEEESQDRKGEDAPALDGLTKREKVRCALLAASADNIRPSIRGAVNYLKTHHNIECSPGTVKAAIDNDSKLREIYPRKRVRRPKAVPMTAAHRDRLPDTTVGDPAENASRDETLEKLTKEQEADAKADQRKLRRKNNPERY